MPPARGKPGPPCHVCKHPRRAEIELMLARGVAVSAVAKRYDVSGASLRRHKTRPKCMPDQLKAKLIAGPDVAGLDLEKVREAEGQSLLLHLVNQRNRIFAAFDAAEEVGHIHGIIRVSAELRSINELIGKIVGQLGSGTTVNNNVLFVSPAYVEMRVALVRALGPYPDARHAVAAVLHGLESKAAKDIEADTRVLEFTAPQGEAS